MSFTQRQIDRVRSTCPFFVGDINPVEYAGIAAYFSVQDVDRRFLDEYVLPKALKERYYRQTGSCFPCDHVMIRCDRDGTFKSVWPYPVNGDIYGSV